ncbi:MAG: glycine oxidase ThiO [Candidatus Eremiobacteraeota bacterium]|nr:glycine oxidase ThiO [Candidatus Eremiobacteraeota bacterium]MBV8498276.1 glycine oxidase ThiO [Candidatus Eremiobacteraeota bacterium]
MSRTGDVVIVGAGVIGLAIAFELIERGASVRVIDRGEPAGAASWAAAGMLAPYTERVRHAALVRFCAASLQEYPGFIARVAAASGVDAHLRLDGVVHAAFDGAELESLLRHAQTLAAERVDCEILERSSLLASEPWLGAFVVGGLRIAGEGCIDNRRLGRALLAACAARGARVERSSIVRLECDRRRALGVHTERGFVAAGAIVNACGAWAGRVDGVPAHCAPPVAPIKGQMIALAAPIGLVRRPTWVPGAYLVPRDDGRLLIGATVESAGFDERITAAGVHELLHAALAAAPALRDFAITESWAGLRPGTPDGLPFLGRTPLEGLLLATGHYRNGILMAPATARSIADAVEGRDTGALEAFTLARIGTEEAFGRRITHA